ncbi:MAG: CusA/CzcA family heavy metal efflux RND transporter [Verrucomicrobia bacterium]|nr:CusA/CzcA family heavy metal efflux RND transporter [Verrucomicrobiota bacterium]
MIEQVINFSIRYRWLVLLASLGVAGLGAYEFQYLPIDAVPDVTNVQVQINTAAYGLSAPEIEQRITYPIETAMAGLPSLESTRSLSYYGLSQVTVVFKEGSDIYLARQLITERLREAQGELPDDAKPELSPIATGLGEIYLWTVNAQPGARKPDGSSYTLTDLREIQDWVIKPRLKNVPGVVEVNSIGGFEKQYHVTPYPDRLLAFRLSFQDLVDALKKNNSNIGAGYIEKNGEQYLIRSPGQVRTLSDIRGIVIATRDGQAIRVRDVADVVEASELRTGAATRNGQEAVLGTTFMLIGENSRAVANRVSQRVKEINQVLPPGVVATTVYNRTNLVDSTIGTVRQNLFEGALLVVVVLLALLGNVRAALIVAAIIPLAMLFTITGMVQSKISANLMSLGALDFGIIVDGAVIIVENCVRNLSEEQQRLGRLLNRPERLATVLHATKEVITPSIFGLFIIMVVYLPILSLSGVEGKMFIPMARTVLFALLGAMLFSVTFVPASVAIFLRGRMQEKESFLIRWAKKLYLPLLNVSLKNRGAIVVTALSLVGLCVVLGTRMGAEFIPSLDEGDFALSINRVPGTSLTEAIQMQKSLEAALLKVPEVKEVFTRIGNAEVATDAQPPSIGDGYVILKPRKAWPNSSKSKDAVAREINEVIRSYIGNKIELSQPIQMRMNELISGVKGDVAIKVFGDDLDDLQGAGQKIAAILTRIPGVEGVNLERVAGLPFLNIEPKPDVISRYGLSLNDVQQIIETAIGGEGAGEFFQGDRRFPIVVRLPEALRDNVDALKRIPILLPAAEEGSEDRIASVNGPNYVPLSEVADFEIKSGPNQINREDGKRRIVVTCNIRGRDIGSFVGEARSKIDGQLKLPSGYWMEWGGQFEQLQSATQRLTVVVPLALLLIFALLFMAFGTAADALLIYTGIPLALTGGILALWLRGIPLSISAGVGFIALSGVAVLNGAVMISFIRRLRAEGSSLYEAIRAGSLTRLRPVLMTALVASLGFVPMAVATGRGAEVQRPLATVVIGGITSSTLLTLLVLPVLYSIFHRERERERVIGDQ